MAEKKVKLFIVEGPSDETAFALIFERIFSSDAVSFDVVHGDVTTRLGGRNARNAVRQQLIDHVMNEVYDWSDLLEVVHIVDSDGVYIDDGKVIASDSDRPEYGLELVKAPNPKGIRRRNHAKAAALNELCGVKEITVNRKPVPYGIYFLSRNLEHALHGVVDGVSDREKERLAREFQRKYREDLNGFAEFMRDEIGIAGDYASTWNHLREGENSLARGSNLHLFLPDQM